MRTLGTLAISIAAIFSMSAHVHANEVDPEMTVRLQTLYPKTKFQQINKSPVSGLTEVVMGQNIAYVDPTGRYFLFGKLYDMKAQQDLTANRMEELQKIDLSRLDLSLAFKRIQGTGSRVLYVFSDPDCPYCKQLEKSLVALENVTIHTFMMPLASIHPDARRKAVGVWCAKDRAAAWDDLMLRGKETKGAVCDHPVDKVVALAESLGINGTPTLFSADGRKLAGARDTEAISKWLDNAASMKTARKE
jgi:thiol:disulfide interchange protein DsbC